MTMTHKERLLRLADVMDTVEPGLLSMGLWFVKPFSTAVFNLTERGAELVRGCLADATTRDRARLLQDLSASGHCGFAGCAVGWATQDPVLQAEGLTMDLHMGQPVFGPDGEFGSWDAVEKFFGLTPKQAEYLFIVEEYSENRELDEEFGYHDPHPRVVADRLRHFARTNWYEVPA